MAPSGHRLRPADLGGRHPAHALLGAGLRTAAGHGRRLPADRRQAGRLLGDAHRGGDGAAGRATAPTTRPADDAEQREKVIVRSNGTVTYVGKDMAYQFWKLGLLGHDFHYRPFATRARRRDRCGPRPATRRWPRRRTRRSAPPRATVNVIDVRQAYLQKLLKQALAAAGHPVEAGATTPTSPTRWWRCRTPPPGRWASRRRPTPTTPGGRSSRCRAARASASRPTTCSTG